MSAPAELAAAAAGWVVRLSGAAADEGDWEAFRGWLDSDPGARAAYDRALDIWLLPSGSSAPERAPAQKRAGWLPWSAAAGVVGLLAAAASLSAALFGPGSAGVLQTQAGGGRLFQLADGSRVRLGRDSQIVVQFGPRLRRVVMEHGDAAFQVAQHGLRPFRVIVGDDALTGSQTRFGVHRRNGRLQVVVREGALAVGPAEGDRGPRVRLTPGSVLDHVEGTQSFQVGAADSKTRLPGDD